MIATLFTIAIVGLSVIGLAVGIMAGRRPIQGSCGGVACLKNISCIDCPNRKMVKEDAP